MSGKHNFALHSMLADTFSSARAQMEKTAGDPPPFPLKDDEEKDKKDKKDEKDKNLPPFMKSDKEKDGEKDAGINYAYFDKLAGATEHVLSHLDDLVDNRSTEEKIAEALYVAEKYGLLKEAVDGPAMKDAGNAPSNLTPPKSPGMGKGLHNDGPSPANAMANDESTAPGGGGEQPYKHDKSKTMNIPTSTPLTNPALASGSSTTMMENDADQAPGGGSGSVPTAEYPETGVFKEGSAIPARFRGILDKIAMSAQPGPRARVIGPRPGFKGHATGAAHGPGVVNPVKAGTFGTAGKAIGPGGKSGGVKTGSPLVGLILQKLAEENSGASPSAGKGSTTVDGGNFPGTQAEEGVPSEQKPAQARMVASNQAAVDYTKRDGKADPKKDLKKVLDEPAQVEATDSKLKENLGPVVDQAGAKIASKEGGKVAIAAARELLRRALSDGGADEALKTAMSKLSTDFVGDDASEGLSGSSEEEEIRERDEEERRQSDFADVLETASRIQGEGEGSGADAAPAVAPDVPETV